MDPNVFKAVMAVGRRMGASRKQLLAAAETGLVESGFRNLPGGDADSQGWRQERRSLYPNPTNVQASAARFFQEAKQHDRPGLTAGQLAANVQRPAAQYRGRYSQAEARAAALLGMKGGGGDASAQAASVGGSTTTNLPGATFKTTVPTVDQSGFEQARRNAIIGQLIARRNPNSILLRSGLLSTVEPSLSEFMGQQTTTSRVPGKTITVPGAPASGGGGGATQGGRRGKVTIFNANPGRLHKGVVQTAEQIAGVFGAPLRIDSGATHSKLTVNGNVSEHYSGHATDIPMSGARLTRLGQDALIAVGVPASVARKQRGGLFNVTADGRITTDPSKRKYQIIFNTMTGGNHYTHLHVGVR